MANTVYKRTFDLSNGYLADSEPVYGSNHFIASGTVAVKHGKALKKAADYALAAEDIADVIAIELTAASKTVTLGLKTGETVIVANVGDTNAFTVKNIAADTGSSLAAGKVAIFICSEEEDKTVKIALN